MSPRITWCIDNRQASGEAAARSGGAGLSGDSRPRLMRLAPGVVRSHHNFARSHRRDRGWACLIVPGRRRLSLRHGVPDRHLRLPPRFALVWWGRARRTVQRAAAVFRPARRNGSGVPPRVALLPFLRKSPLLLRLLADYHSIILEAILLQPPKDDSWLWNSRSCRVRGHQSRYPDCGR